MRKLAGGLMAVILCLPIVIEAGLTMQPGSQTIGDRTYSIVCEEETSAFLPTGNRQVAGLTIAKTPELPDLPDNCRWVETTGMSGGEVNAFLGGYTTIDSLEQSLTEGDEISGGDGDDEVVGNTGDDDLSPGEGLVPGCRAGDTDCDEAFAPDNYGACEFVELVNNVIRFVLGLTAVLAVFAFLYSAFLFVTSQGDAATIARGKQVFANVLIGFLIMLSAFLVVNTVLSVLLGDGSEALSWERVECSYANRASDPNDIVVALENEFQYTDEYTPVVVTSMPTAFPGGSTTGGGGVSSAGCSPSSLSVGDVCYAPNRCLVNTSGGVCTRISPFDAYIEAAAAKHRVPADRLRGVMITESGGNPNAVSPVGAIGLMQIMPATGARSCGLSEAQLFNPALNIDCGARYYAEQYRTFGTHDLAAAAYNAGPGRNSPSRDCPGLTQWQCPYDSGGCCEGERVVSTSCTINRGFQETRMYVDKVNAASPLCRR